jgi:pyruvate dehydrogenase E2 component (dihydrolipoamide acetyltransferase)
VLLGDGESAGAAPAPKPQPAQSAPPPAPTATAAARSAAGSAPAAAAAATSASSAPPPSGPAAANGSGSHRTFASPLARRLAKEAGLDLAAVAGTGPHGRIVRSDVDAAARNGAAASAAGTAVMTRPSPGVALPPAMADAQVLALYDKGSYEVIPHDNMRKVIAQRLTLSKQTIPHFRLAVDCRIDELLRARERMNAASPKDGPRAYKLSVNDFVIKALALALAQVPAANVTWTDGGTLRHKYSDIGVAVAIDGGLFTPIIRHAELKSLSEISNEMRDLAERARKRRLAPHEYQGGSTSISNLGMYGIKSFDAVINPPHATILAVGTGEKRAIVVGDKVEVATLMSCTLSCDHRVVDGAIGAELLNAFKALIEDPVRMLV